MGLIADLVTFKNWNQPGQGLFCLARKSCSEKLNPSFWNFLAFLCKEPWGYCREIRECDMMGAAAKGKLKFLLPPEKQWSVLTGHNFSWSFKHEIVSHHSPFCPSWDCLFCRGKKTNKNQIRSNVILQIPALWGSWIPGIWGRLG